MNSYGNFVVQNALKYATLEDRTKLADQIERNIPNITDMKIKQKWTSLLKKNNKSLAEFKGNHHYKSNLIGLKSVESDGNGSERSYKSKKSSTSGLGQQDYQAFQNKGQMNKGFKMPQPVMRS